MNNQSIIDLLDSIDSFTGSIPQSMAHKLFQTIERAERIVMRKSVGEERTNLLARIDATRAHIRNS